MQILYDHQIFSLQKYGGISRYFVELYKNLPKEAEGRFSLHESDNVYVKDWKGIRPYNDKFNHFLFQHDFRGKWRLHVWLDRFRKHKYYPDYNTNYSIELLKQGNYDIFHPTYFSDYFLPYLNGKPFVLTIHDMIPELYPQYFKQDDVQIIMKRKLAPLASAIIAVSENTKQDIIRILGIPEEKVHVVYHGCSFAQAPETQSPFPFPYVLFVGARYKYKNFVPFVKSIASVLNSHKELHIVCTGHPFSEEENELINGIGFGDRFIYQWIADDTTMYNLYHHAVCFAYPSEYEGFGIPILEAYQADCIVMLNKASCFPEIAQEAAIYFKLDDEQNNFAERLETVLSMSARERESLLLKQRQRLSHFSWRKSAEKMVSIYNSCAFGKL